MLKTFSNLALLTVLLSSCATLPKATVDMSMLLNKQLQALETNHIQIIDKHFEVKREQSLDFLDNEWYPDYLNRFFSNDEAEEIWNEIVDNPDKKTRISDLQEVVEIIQEKYMAKRDSLLLPLEESHIKALELVRGEYSKAKTMNSAVLSNVASVNDIQEARREYLSKLVDVDSIENTISTYFERADKILDEARKGIEKYEEAESKIGSVLDKLSL